MQRDKCKGINKYSVMNAKGSMQRDECARVLVGLHFQTLCMPKFLLILHLCTQPKIELPGRALKHAAMAHPLQLPAAALVVLCHGLALGTEAAAAAAAEASQAGEWDSRAAAAASLGKQHSKQQPQAWRVHCMMSVIWHSECIACCVMWLEERIACCVSCGLKSALHAECNVSWREAAFAEKKEIIDT
eukprot:1160231-Pelagomonas_calceolata.AAC.6